METYRKDELSVMVGKIWIIDENKDTVKIKVLRIGIRVSLMSVDLPRPWGPANVST